MKEPTIAVCITTHARPELLREALTSAIEQTHAVSEIVVSDNVGDDDTARVVADFSSLGRIEVHHVLCAGAGPVENANHALLGASSELIVMLHDDDLLYPGALLA